MAHWLRSTAEIRSTTDHIQQGLLVLSKQEQPSFALTGSVDFATSGLGLRPGPSINLVQESETAADSVQLANWFGDQWQSLPGAPDAKAALLAALDQLASRRAPSLIYALILNSLFASQGDALDEEQIVKSATGIRNTQVWKKLYKFQRDGVVGAIDKLNRFGGCIIADSVGLGKTFEALAIIKYHELRNDRVLVLCPKRLRDNWTLYRANDRGNMLAADRFNYDVLNHTDLSRDRGLSG
ncbi:MAG TPA: SNF2-related protein, partial [Rhodanobacteraceae bacterium]